MKKTVKILFKDGTDTTLEIEDIFTDQYFKEKDEKVAAHLRKVTTSLMMMQMLTENK